MKILILGAAGFLGSNLVRRCVAKGWGVTAVDSLDPLLKSSEKNLETEMPHIRFIKGDIRDQALMSSLVKECDLIFNCAAQTSHPLSLKFPIYDAEVNCVGNLTVLEAIRNENPSVKIIYPSSSTVIGASGKELIDESHPERPLEIYSANKGVAEKYYQIYNISHGLNTVVLRFANLYGPNGKESPEFGFLNYFINLAWDKKVIKIFGEGHQIRNVMHVDDAVDAMFRAAEVNSLAGTMHFAVSHYHHSLADVAQEIVKISGRGSIQFIPWPEERKKMEVGDVRISGSKFEEVTGWSAKLSLRAGLESTFKVLGQKRS